MRDSQPVVSQAHTQFAARFVYGRSRPVPAGTHSCHGSREKNSDTGKGASRAPLDPGAPPHSWRRFPGYLQLYSRPGDTVYPDVPLARAGDPSHRHYRRKRPGSRVRQACGPDPRRAGSPLYHAHAKHRDRWRRHGAVPGANAGGTLLLCHPGERLGRVSAPHPLRVRRARPGSAQGLLSGPLHALRPSGAARMGRPGAPLVGLPDGPHPLYALRGRARAPAMDRSRASRLPARPLAHADGHGGPGILAQPDHVGRLRHRRHTGEHQLHQLALSLLSLCAAQALLHLAVHHPTALERYRAPLGGVLPLCHRHRLPAQPGHLL